MECIYFLTNMQPNHSCCQHTQEFCYCNLLSLFLLTLTSSPALYDRFSSFINLSCLQVVHLPLHFFILSVVVFETRSNGLIFSPHLHLHYLRGVFRFFESSKKLFIV